MEKPPKELVALCKKVVAKRPKTAIDHILKHGFITTEDLKERYGYNHPPRAARDVREHGIPIETYRVVGGDGRKIYLEEMPERDLQIDHRVPYEVAGDCGENELNPDDFMLLCGSANRAKSWSCEHCRNWTELKNREICLTSYWAYPENYEHIAMRQIRRLDLLWHGEEVATYEKLKAEARDLAKEIPAFVKEIIEQALKKKK